MRTLAFVAAIALLVPVVPVAAQRSTGPAPAPALPGSSVVGPSLGRASDAIRDGRRSGQLSRGEAKRARRERGQIDTLADRYSADGYLSDSERREIDTRAEVLRATVNAERLRGDTRRR
ncbi:hypothetical protein FHS96_000131 [Sphingomonas zeicaulis]|uniref:hypothetical protein n=1 Tax=Sphingomonas zeicaulis TaxID=1632740 RepID=UPI003D254FE4